MPIAVDRNAFALGGYADQNNRMRELDVQEADQNLKKQKSQFEQGQIKKQEYLDMVGNQAQQLQNYMSRAVDPAHIQYGQQVAEKLKAAYGGAVAQQLGVDGYVNQMIDLAVRTPTSGDMIPGGEPTQPKPQKEAIETAAPETPGSQGEAFGPLTKQQILEKYPEELRGQIRAVAFGDQRFPAGNVLKTPEGRKLMQGVYELNPGANGQTFSALQDFKNGKHGDQIKSFSVGISHLNTLNKLAEDLDNGNIQAFNKLAQSFAKETGNPAPTNFDAAKKIVGGEIIKSIIGAGGTGEDRAEAQAEFDKAGSPKQILGAVKTVKDLMKGQLSGLKKQYQTSTQRDDFISLLSDEAKAEFLQEPHIQEMSDEELLRELSGG